jgi:hypothetical protein
MVGGLSRPAPLQSFAWTRTSSVRDDNFPAVLVWAHCDDFFIHGPTKDKTIAALTAFLNCAVDVGLLCHPGKLTPPAHAVKYIGFIFDSVAESTVRIPEYKVAKAIALRDYGRAHHWRISRLALAVIMGVLESLVEAIPTRIGHTYLRHLQGTLHPERWAGDDLSYFSYASLSEADLHELDLWSWLLLHNHGRRARATKSGTLVPSFGDGSGTGTGGTVQYREAEPFDMWMGVWSPRLYRFTSNWKEMRTLLATLERAKAQRRQDISGVTFFYFTDNTTTYFAVTSGSSTAPSLHDMVEKIKQLELELDIILEVVHVPGTTIITEGTDGLSRGIWISSLHNKPRRRELLAEIFAPVPFTPDLGKWVMNEVGFPPRFDNILDTLTIWAPPREVASQLIYALL